MGRRMTSLVLVACACFAAPAFASESELVTTDQHLEWSRRIDQNRDPLVTGSIDGREEVRVDVRQRQCSPSRTPGEGTFAASTGPTGC
jgi:hypothetical protein